MEEIKQGYKQTDIGVIPIDWEVKTIGKIGLFSKGNGISRAESNTGIIPSVRYGEIYTTHDNYIKKFYSFISLEIANRAKKLKVGDILFTASGETKEDIGKNVAFIDDIEAYAGGDIIILSPKNADSLFLGYLFNAPYVAKQKANKGQGDAVVHITKDSLRDIVVAIPKFISEQTAIATALSDTDALIASLDKKIAKKQQMKQGAMQQLLTGKKRLPGFNGEWVEKRVDEFSDTSSGGTPSRSNSNFYTGNIPWVTTGELNDGYISCTKEYISEEALNCSSAKLFPANTVLMAMYGATIGKLGIINIPASTNQACCAFLCDNQLVDNKFLFYKLRFIRNELISLGSGAGQPNISQTVIRNLSLCMPNTKTEQTAIAQILTDMDNEIAQLEKERDKYKKIKAGMMQVLLTGRVRLV